MNIPWAIWPRSSSTERASDSVVTRESGGLPPRGEEDIAQGRGESWLGPSQPFERAFAVSIDFFGSL